jgi:hypothetical protein
MGPGRVPVAAAPVLLVGGHELGHAQARGAALRQQLSPGAERVWQALAMACGVCARAGRGVEHALPSCIDHKAAAHGVVLAHGDVVALRIQCMERHAVGVQRQAFAAKQQVVLFDKRHGMLAQQRQRAALADLCDGGGDLVGVDMVWLMPGQAEQHGAVGAVAHAGGREGAEQLHRDLVHGRQSDGVAHMAGKLPGRNHGPHGVGAGRPDADLEEVENADGHGGGDPGSKEVPQRLWRAGTGRQGGALAAALPRWPRG